MKKTSNTQRRLHRKHWLLFQREKIARNKKRRRYAHERSFERKLISLGINTKNVKNIRYDFAKRQIQVISLPSSLNFNQDYENTVNIFKVIRKTIETGSRFSRLDFSKIKNISTAAALVLVSLVDQWNERVRGKLKADLPTWDKSLIKLMLEMGFFDLLKLDKPKIDNGESPITYVPFTKGRVGENDAGARAKQLRIRLETITDSQINRHFLFEGLSEAITNTCHHAYRDIDDVSRKYWWLTGSYDSNSKLLQVTFFDRGIGIPRTLPSHRNFELIKDFFGIWKDSEKIKAAMEIGRTSTGRPERGKGLQNLVEFAKCYPKGSLRITSLRGTFRESYNNLDESSKKCYDELVEHEGSIGGTLIQWSVYL